MSAAEALLDAGIHVSRGPSGFVTFITTIDGHKHTADAVVVTRVRSVSRAEVATLDDVTPFDNHVVLIAPVITEATRTYIEVRGWSWICAPRGPTPVTGRLQLPEWDVVDLGTDPGTTETARRGRRPWGQISVIRRLLRGGSWSQTDLAKSAAVTQPRVSQILSQLTADEVVGRFQGSTSSPHPHWQATRWEDLANQWLETYPGPGGLATYWYSLESISDQALRAVSAVERARPEDHVGEPVVSADPAADHIAPFRRPQLAVIYSRWGVDLEDSGFTPTSPDGATLRLVVPDDWSVWPPPDDPDVRTLAPSADFQLADPLQIVWDLLHGPTQDADQAAEAVMRALASHAIAKQMS